MNLVVLVAVGFALLLVAVLSWKERSSGSRWLLSAVLVAAVGILGGALVDYGLRKLPASHLRDTATSAGVSTLIALGLLGALLLLRARRKAAVNS